MAQQRAHFHLISKQGKRGGHTPPSHIKARAKRGGHTPPINVLMLIAKLWCNKCIDAHSKAMVQQLQLKQPDIDDRREINEIRVDLT